MSDRQTGFQWVRAILASLVLLGPSAALAAPVNYGDFNGTNVDFLQVTEETQTAGDPDQLWDAPSLAGSGDQLAFFPSNFTSLCTTGGSDVTTSELTIDLESHSGVHIETMMLVEQGDAVLVTFPPFGTSATNGTSAISGSVTVTETTSGPIAPVVIPFTGTFTPSATFELPANFGSSQWTGNVFVDVAAVVPLATKAVVLIENSLSTNCAGAGNVSAKVQKKVVSGPSVALLVNPIECDIELDKTCCVPQPVLPDLDICEGDVIRAVFEYTGDRCRNSNNEQGKAFKCYGRHSPGEPVDITILKNANISATPDTGVLIGDLVEFSSSTGTLSQWLKFKTVGPDGLKQRIKMDTSCERALECGDQFGAYKLVELESTLGGYVDCSAPPPPASCAPPTDPVGTPCDAKLVDMVLEYNGQICQDPLANPQSGEAYCEGDATGGVNVGVEYVGMHGDRQIVSPSSSINDGDLIRVTATFQGGLFPNQQLIITDGSGILQEVGFHVSCSQPLALGDEFGSFKLVEFTTKNGTTASLGDGTDGTRDQCEIPLAPPKPHCTSDLQSVTMVYIGDYLGEGCTVSNGQSGNAGCSGVADPGDPVSVSVLAGTEVSPEDLIQFGDLVTITADPSGDLPALTNLSTLGAGGTQSIYFKTSCHKPLSLGDRFGAWVVFGMDRESDGPITLGGNIQYQYKVTNPNADPLENVSVDDDQLGNIVSGQTIAAGETETYIATATLYGTTTNVATATGDVGGDICFPGVDQVTVDVVVPPDGAFSCSCGQSFSELTLIWNGAQTIDLIAWDGPIGSTQLASINNIAPGDEVTVAGFTNSTSTWTLFEAGTMTKIGDSRFELTCRDRDMNGVQDCGKNQGNSKNNDANLINDWLLEGMVDDDETLTCSPTFVPPPPDCGFGPELMFLLPGLMWLHRRRLSKA